jgi:glutamine amidotransferase-like uncharacterized protein
MKYINVGKGKIRLVGKCSEFTCEICPEYKKIKKRCPEIDRNKEQLKSKVIKLKVVKK